MFRTLKPTGLIQLLKNNTPTKHIAAYSTQQPAVQDADEKMDRQIKQYEKLTNVVHRTRTKKPQRRPFAKDLFVGQFDTEVLTYPQLEKEDIEQLEGTVEKITSVVNKELNGYDKFDQKVVKNLADYRLVGLQRSSFENGLECNVSEHMKILEVLSEGKLRNEIVHNEQLGVQTLVKFAGDQLRKRILDEHKCIAYCMAEENLTSLDGMATKAVKSGDGKSYVLNGEKIWVVNGQEADYYIVFALTELIERDKLKFPKLTAFLVGKNMNGVSTSKYNIENTQMAKVKFENTLVPVENIIGEDGKGEQMLSSIINDFRLSQGPICIAISKLLVNKLYEYVLSETTPENLLLKTDAVREKLGQIALKIYTMESLVFLTSGLIDSYENQDCELESAIVKYYCSQKAQEIATTCINFIGTPALEQSHLCQQLYKETLKLSTLHETNDNLKILIALMGIKHAGNALNDEIRMARNPLFHAPEVIKRMWRLRNDYDDKPKIVLRLNEYLHPSLLMAATNLEYCVHRLKFGADQLLMRHGADIVNMHMELKRIADVAIDVYALTAVLGRASRSYCIGLQHGDFEMLMANAYSNDVKERVQYRVRKIYEGMCQTNDENLRIIAKRLVKFKGYFPVHPLARNF